MKSDILSFIRKIIIRIFGINQGGLLMQINVKNPEFGDMDQIGYIIQYKSKYFTRFHNLNRKIYFTENDAIEALTKIKENRLLKYNDEDYCLIPVFKIKEGKLREIKINSIIK